MEAFEVAGQLNRIDEDSFLTLTLTRKPRCANQSSRHTERPRACAALVHT